MHIIPVSQLFNHTILGPDENGRKIEYCCLDDCFLTGRNMCYPNILIKPRDIPALISPYDEMIMSLKKTTFYDPPYFEQPALHKPSTRIADPMFFFAFNFDNYYHFLYDTIPYIIAYRMLKKSMPNLKLLVALPNPTKEHLYKFNIEMFDLLGITADLHFCKTDEIYSNIYISNSLTHGGYSNKPPRSEVYELFNDIVHQVVPKAPAPSKIYISRRSWIHDNLSNIGTNYTTRRRFMNEDQYVQYLQREGYEEVFPETMSMKQKISMFHNATHIAGCIGGGMCNLLFSRPNTIVTCIVSPYFLDINRRFQFAMNHCRITYITNTKVHTNVSHSHLYPLYIRVKCPTGEIGEVIQITHDNKYIVNVANEGVAGFNFQVGFSKVVFSHEELYPLDLGLNSPFTLDEF